MSNENKVFNWEPSEDAKVIIVCAANQFEDGLIIAGARHFDNVMHGNIKRVFNTRDNRADQSSMSEQGFIDQYGRFYSREDAFKIVQENGQPFDLDRNGSHSVLYSEGLY